MPQPNAVVQPVKARADPQSLPYAAKPQPQIGMLKTFAKLGDCHNRNELARSHTNQLRYQHNRNVDQHIVQQVVAVVAPHRHLPLGMVH